MFQLITPIHKKEITRLVNEAGKADISQWAADLKSLIQQIREDIPEKKRISYGRYSIIKKMGLEMYPLFEKAGRDIYDFATEIFNRPEHDEFVRSLAVQLISIYGLESGNLPKVLVVFEKAAADEHWEMRECSAGFIRKLIRKYPEPMKKWYLKQVRSPNPLLRRFASESIRPVADNAWFKKHPEFAFSVIENLFAESAPYPKTSVGNNLSDWARIDPEKVYEIVETLVKNGDKNSYWIAYRACRNLVKKDPVRVMDLLGVDEYRYKKRVHFRKDFIQK